MTGADSEKVHSRWDFFRSSHLTLQKWFLLMYWWSREYPVTEVAKVVEVGASVDVYRWLREVCSTKTPIVLGGLGHCRPNQ